MVLERAPAKVSHGAIRLHGSASLPLPDTQVRVAWALAGTADNAVTAEARMKADIVFRCIKLLPRVVRRIE